MDTTYLVIIITTVIILISVILVIVLLTAVRKINKGNRIIKLEASEIQWKELKCPQCQKVMDTGLSLAGRGIIWREKTEKTEVGGRERPILLKVCRRHTFNSIGTQRTLAPFLFIQ